MNSKIIISSLVLGLLPITAVPAEAGVKTCKTRQTGSSYEGYKYTKKVCVYSPKGSSKKGYTWIAP